MASGIATMSKALVLGTVHKYDWFQVGAAINHPDKGKVLDVSQDIQKQTGVEDANVKILPWTGYGNADLVRQIINSEQPDAILHFTDPRYWIWLYEMEHEIRQNIPIMFYAIWDDLPDPLYNRNYYESCDWIGCISRQTYGIVSRLTSRTDKPTWKPHSDWQVSYVPHGINPDEYKPAEVPPDFKSEILNGKDYDFIFFWSNRNSRRKQPSDLIMAFNEFCKKIGEEKASKVALVMHTQPTDQNGTDLPRVHRHLCPEYDVCFTYQTDGRPFNDKEMNLLFNSADVYINLASNEGFGLGSCEAMTVGTPIIVNVTGGLQDQCGFKKDGEFLTPDDYIELGSNHLGTYTEHGEWVFPVFPSNRSLQGSPATPYIWDDRCQPETAAIQLRKLYNMDREERKRLGSLGTEFCKENLMTSQAMGQRFIDSMNGAFDKWKPQPKYYMEAV